MLQAGFATLPAAMTMTTATAALSSAVSGVCQPLVVPQVSVTGAAAATQTSLQPFVSLAPPGDSSIISVLAPDVSKLSTSVAGDPAKGGTARSGFLMMQCPVSATGGTLIQNSDAQVGFDLANGWKVVGLTSVMDGLPGQPSSSQASVLAGSPPVNSTASNMASTSDSTQWKIVGLTSLNTTANSGVSDPASVVPPVCLIGSSNTSSSAVLAQNSEAPAAMLHHDVQSVGTASTLNKLNLSGGDWKIAGITTLPIPPVPAVGLPTELAESSADETVGSTCEEPKWRVVGVTSLPSHLTEKASSHQVETAAEINASTSSVSSSVLSTSTNLTPLVGEGGWKVVGVVPLPPGGDSPLPKNTQPQENCEEPRASDLLSQTKTSTKLIQILQSSATHKKENKKLHPLSFLPNCSNQFRNAILKKNTVSTMLELKRAYQQKMRREGKLFVPAPSSLNIPSGQDKPLTHHKLQKEAGFLSSVETDDRLVLSKHYRSQMVCNTRQEALGMQNKTNVSLLCHKGEEAGYEHTGEQDSWPVYCAERGELVMSDSGSSSDGVNLTAVDPWGVCTDDDMDDVADMMADKESRSVQSSSRKRKLTTPRKMIQ